MKLDNCPKCNSETVVFAVRFEEQVNDPVVKLIIVCKKCGHFKQEFLPIAADFRELK